MADSPARSPVRTEAREGGEGDAEGEGEGVDAAAAPEGPAPLPPRSLRPRASFGVAAGPSTPRFSPLDRRRWGKLDLRAVREVPAGLFPSEWAAELFHVAAQQAKLAYRDPGERQEQLDANWKEWAFFEDEPTDAQAYVLRHAAEPRVVVAFRGTANQKDAAIDARYDLVPWPGLGREHGKCRVHQGFLEQWLALRDRVMALVRSMVWEGGGAKEVLVCGHSLGGAVGTLCSVDVAMQEASVIVSQMTFGSPRVGNKRFAQLFNREVDVSYRIVNKRDIIPCTPPRIKRCAFPGGRVGTPGPGGVED